MDAKQKSDLDDLGALASLVATNLNTLDANIVEGSRSFRAKKLDPRELLMKELQQVAPDEAQKLVTAETLAAGQVPFSVDMPPGYKLPVISTPLVSTSPVAPIYTNIRGVDVKIENGKVYTKEWRDLSDTEAENYRTLTNIDVSKAKTIPKPDTIVTIIQKLDWYESVVTTSEVEEVDEVSEAEEVDEPVEDETESFFIDGDEDAEA